jgi:uncharacterized protein
MANERERGRFVWHELMTSDPKAAQDFYKEVVGWDTAPFEGAPMEYTMWMAGQQPVGGVMDIPKEAKDMGTPPNWLAYVAVPNVNETIELTKKLGGGVYNGPITMPNVGTFAILHDPQHAAFAVITGEGENPPESDPQQLEFSWHELMTTDYKAADDFYGKLFGWETKSEFDMGPEMGTYHMFGRDRFTYGGMMNKPEFVPAPPHWLHYVQVDSADAAAERAEKAGGKVVNGPMEVPGGDRIAQIIDPQGAAFAVHSKAAK